jgi:hypothetical protein
MSEVSRRDFLKLFGVGALGIVAGPRLLRGWNLDGPGDVVQCFDDTSVSGPNVNTSVVQVMVDEMIKTLTGISDVGGAWRSLFPGITTSSIIGIKVNCYARQYFATHPEVAYCIASGLGRMSIGGSNFPRNNIIIWDNENSDLTSAGYTLYTGSDPDTVRCFGTDQSGIGYDTNTPLNVNGVTSYPSRILSQICDYIIDAAVLKTHSTAVVTLAMKNNYGSIHNPGSLHGGSCNPYLPSLNQQIRDVITPNNIQKLFFIDALFGICSGGPVRPPDCRPRTLVMSQDIVACDVVGQSLINAERARRNLSPVSAAHITTAARPPYSLGTTSVNLTEIYNPTGGNTRRRRKAVL